MILCSIYLNICYFLLFYAYNKVKTIFIGKSSRKSMSSKKRWKKNEHTCILITIYIWKWKLCDIYFNFVKNLMGNSLKKKKPFIQ